MKFQINFPAVLVAALARVIVVFLWWSPLLFLNPWMKLTGNTRETMKSGMVKGTVFAVAGSFVMAAVLDCAIQKAPAQSTGAGAAEGFLIWLGFVAVTMLSPVIYERKPFRLFLINSGFQLAALVCMGMILAAWR
ncbi:MAG: DUF1761 domain-containing protein [Syntrophobacteraceae bacterium]